MLPKSLVEKLRTQGQRTEAGLVRDILNKQMVRYPRLAEPKQRVVVDRKRLSSGEREEE